MHQTIPPPTMHHFTLNTVINVSVNAQNSPDIRFHSAPFEQEQYPMQYHSDCPSTLFPYLDSNLSLYLKDIDLHTLDHFSLPSCPNPQDYLTVEGLLTFLMSDKHRLRHSSYQVKFFESSL